MSSLKKLEYGFLLPHGRIARNLGRAEELGLEIYITQLEERQNILNSPRRAFARYGKPSRRTVL